MASKIYYDRCNKEIEINNIFIKYLKYPKLLDFKYTLKECLLCDNCYRDFERFMKYETQ